MKLWTRRRVLQGMLGAGVLALGGREVAAQSRGLGPEAGSGSATDGGRLLHMLPRHALVIGNSRYKEAPLRNPANDAYAIAAQLKGFGFQVAQVLDAGRAAMLDAISAYNEALARQGAIGLFYFAGHGVQLAWRNYLLPVDAVVDNPDDVRERAVELNTLLQGLTRAKNPMNMIILDACRDNPFGTRVRPEQRGLSQFDAPLRSLLAYATAPGNVASDGDGENGLYTESLLRELKVPETRIEDVFKRTRLNVRRRSNGRQIPWESTSLEEDFYFLPPKEIRRLSQAEVDKQFDQELAIWEKIQHAQDPQPLEDYLRRFPSGRFTELAQLQLDRVLAKQGEKKIEVISPSENPFSAGTAVANTKCKVGDSYTYRVADLYTGTETGRFTETITEVTEIQVVYDSGLITDLLGNIIRFRDGRRSTGSQLLGVEYAVGRRWATRARVTLPKGQVVQVELDVRVVAREDVTVPAGTFNTFRLEANGWATGPGITIKTDRKFWLVPDRIRAAIASEELRRFGERLTVSSREELVSYRQS